jgi:photosystem II stability/assembly factor-like uncharacterized protein
MKTRITKLILLISIIITKVNFTQVWQPVGLTSEYVKCLSINPSNGYIYAGSLYSEGIFRSTDNGSTWVVKNNGLSVHDVYSIAASPTGQLFVATWGGGMYRSTNNGDSWTQINNGITNTVMFSVALSPLNSYVFAGSGGSGIYLSTDHGNTWALANNGLTSYNILSLAVNTSGYIFAGTYDGVFRSTDNGSSWTQTSITSGWGEAFAANSPLYNIFAGVHTQGVFRSSDGGNNFTLANNGLTQNSVFAIANTASGYVYAGIFGGGGIFLSTNNGDSWAENNVGLTNGDVRAIDIAPNAYVYLATFGGGVFRSTNPIPVELLSFTASLNAGLIQLNWQTATEINNSGFEILKSTDNNYFNLAGFVKGAGNSTAPIFYSFIDSEVKSGERYFFKLKQIDFDGTFTFSNTIEVDIPLPATFSLEQNYPNPFNPSTKIKYNVPGIIANEAYQSQLVTLKVFDVLGNESATLVNEQKLSGTYEVEFDARGLTSGVYFYQLRAGSFIETKKMLLLK